MNRNIESKIFETFFRKRHGIKKVKVFIKDGKTVGTNYDPFRNTGYTVNVQNPVFVNAMVRAISPERLIFKEFGIAETGAKELIVHKRDVNVIKISQKIEIDSENYHVYNDHVGNKLQIFERAFDYYRIIIFRRLK